MLKAITGKTAKELRRGLPTEAKDEIVDWGWVYATLKRRDDTFIEVYVQDEDSPYHGETTKLPPDSFSKGDVLAGNKYTDDENFDEDGDDEANFPDDLIILTHLHEAEVVHCLRNRYAYDKIYTSTGPILLALNPFKNCKKLYNKTVMEDYWKRGELSARGVPDEENPLPPHVYGIADRSFRIMMQTLEDNKSAPAKRGSGKGVLSDQSILVSGESGAGKTVTTKFIMQYLATLSQRSSSSEEVKAGEGQNIEQQVLQSNPILESFGNARTIRNDNSSRFGKFIEIKFNRGALVGASVETYLLEKVRLVSQAEGERNYHIFYELFCMGDEELESYHMGIYNPEDFNMTNRSGTFDRRDGVEDFETFDDLKKAMGILGMSEEVQQKVFTIPAAALHASNVTFLAKSSDESELDSNNPHLEPFLDLMGLSKDELEHAVCYLQIKAGKEYHMRTLPKEKAQKGLEALIKAFYGALFTFLVQQINSSITVKDSSKNRRRVSSASSADEATIGVLDIFGFESFKHNSFEQLCINYCNEALQQQFNLFVLKNEQAEYEREGIEWSFISFPDNQDVLDLIDKKGCGILNILDDQCRAPGTTDKTFCIDIYKKCTGHVRFEADFRQVGAQKFGVNHYAGPVEYDTKGFVEKNRDELPREATDLLFGSKKEIVQELATILSNPNSGGADAKSRSASPMRPGASSVKVTVGSQFSKQLRDLRSKIDLTSPHYVRCLKPNDLLLPDHFNPLIISDQLRYAGVIEAVRVSRVGYPHRYPHTAFVTRYRVLALAELKKAQRASKRTKPIDIVVKALATSVWKIICEQEKAENVAEEKKEDEPPNLISVGIQVGKTKVFLRRNAYEIIEQLRSGKNAESAVLIQSVGRGYIDRREYNQFRHGVISLQCEERMKAAKSLVHDRRLTYRATKIQTLWRKYVQHKLFVATLAVAKWVQRVQRGREGRRRYETHNRARKAIVVQRYLRGFIARKQFNRTIAAVLTIQCATRCRSARLTFKDVKLQARDLNSAVSERDTLKREAQQLRQQLKEANSLLAKAEANPSSAVATEEFEAAQSRIKQLMADAEGMKQELEQSKAELEQSKAELVQSKAKKKDQGKGVKAAEAAAKEATSKAEEQLSRAEKYKKRFIDNHEQIKGLKEEKVKNDEEVKNLRNKLEVVESKKESDAESEKAGRERLEKELAGAQEDLATAKQGASQVSNKLKQVKCKRNLLAEQLETAFSSKDDAAVDISSAELDAARESICDLEQQLAAAKSQEVFPEELDATKRELGEIQEQAAVDLQRKDSEIKSLKKELEAASTVKSKSIAPVVPDAQSAEEILSLQGEVKHLKRELEETKKKTQSAGEIDANSPAALARRYEELRRLAEAGLDKDRQIDKLKARIGDLEVETRIEDLEVDEPPPELNNNEEGDALRTYIDELQKEIGVLKEQADTATIIASQPTPRRSSFLSLMMQGTSTHGPPSQDDDIFMNAENHINKLEDEVEALKEVNVMMRTNIEKSRKKITVLEENLKVEKEISKKELESFARTLRGVDELRTAAEGMSRQVNHYNSILISLLHFYHGSIG